MRDRIERKSNLRLKPALPIQTAADIRIELKRGATTVVVNWPASWCWACRGNAWGKPASSGCCLAQRHDDQGHVSPEPIFSGVLRGSKRCGFSAVWDHTTNRLAAGQSRRDERR